MNFIPLVVIAFLVVVMLGSLALSLTIMIALYGTMVRFMAHYNPKGLQLDLQGDDKLHTSPASPATPSYFGMLSRVYRIEASNLSM